MKDQVEAYSTLVPVVRNELSGQEAAFIQEVALQAEKLRFFPLFCYRSSWLAEKTNENVSVVFTSNSAHSVITAHYAHFKLSAVLELALKGFLFFSQEIKAFRIESFWSKGATLRTSDQESALLDDCNNAESICAQNASLHELIRIHDRAQQRYSNVVRFGELRRILSPRDYLEIQSARLNIQLIGL